MKTYVFSIYDSKAVAFLPPFFLPQKGMAVRAFTDCCTKQGHNFNMHPEDYTLVLLGEFDDANGQFIQHSGGTENLVTGLQAVAQSVEKTGQTGTITLDQSGAENA